MAAFSVQGKVGLGEDRGVYFIVVGLYVFARGRKFVFGILSQGDDQFIGRKGIDRCAGAVRYGNIVQDQVNGLFAVRVDDDLPVGQGPCKKLGSARCDRNGIAFDRDAASVGC